MVRQVVEQMIAYFPGQHRNYNKLHSFDKYFTKTIITFAEDNCVYIVWADDCLGGNVNKLSYIISINVYDYMYLCLNVLTYSTLMFFYISSAADRNRT